MSRFHGRCAEAGIDHQGSVQGSFFRRGRWKKVRGKGSVHPEIPWEIRRGRNRSSEVSSGTLLPPGATEESARKVPKASTYAGGSVGVDVGARYCHCATIDVHPPTLPKKEVLTFGQFREVSSAGGVGRKYWEGSKGKHIRRKLHSRISAYWSR